MKLRLLKLKIRHEEDRMNTLKDELLIDKSKCNIKQYNTQIKKIEEKIANKNIT